MEKPYSTSPPIDIPSFRPPFSEGERIKIVLKPIQVSLMKETVNKGTDTPGFIPLKYARPM